ncbi:hypothetical protein COU37_00680 [Candidatus Micrarchaeota archaeon CG10_big_fil_rev_8_21_14_0_10_45_29]|nr:MAG: hypothetical protein COU37_00680 [Candidatus Micrarchaeota archaeon CG10_big_fil_rev_8_21_14_0_10_45_29]
MSKEIIAAILSFVIPGLGQFYIKSKYAMHYFVGCVVAWILTTIVLVVTIGLCVPMYFVPLAWAIIAAVDAYNEALRKPRIMKEYIK